MFTRLIAGAICLVALTSAAPEPGDLPAVRTPAELRDILADLGPDAIAALGAADPADALNKLGVKQLADNPDKAMSFRYFEAACALSSDKGCNNYANVFNAKDFSRHDAAKALRIYEHLCAKNLAAACINAAVNLRDARKADEAFPFISKSCALDYADGCRRKGVFITYATGTPFSLKGARSAFARACALGDKQGCDNDAFLNTRASELALLEGTDGYSMRGYWANEPNNFVGDGLSALDKKNFARAEAIFAMSCQRDAPLVVSNLASLRLRGPHN
ncbi:MAG: sel1 repeat family protein [Sphingopyxis sp.]|nr:sel1 repeat family protein [Sphingopyxis sp.]